MGTIEKLFFVDLKRADPNTHSWPKSDYPADCYNNNDWFAFDDIADLADWTVLIGLIEYEVVFGQLLKRHF